MRRRNFFILQSEMKSENFQYEHSPSSKKQSIKKTTLFYQVKRDAFNIQPPKKREIFSHHFLELWNKH